MSVEVGHHVPNIGQDMQDGEVVNGNVLFSKESTENAPVKEQRVIKKAKRHFKTSPRKDDVVDIDIEKFERAQNAKVNLTALKNSRKSRSGLGRGLPKKGGAGGKGTWGKPGSELAATEETEDVHDPNYDSDSHDVTIQKVEPALSDQGLIQAVQPILKEYWEHGSTEEVLSSLEELHIGPNRHKITELAVTLALDRHNPQREMTSRLISDLYGNYVSQEDVAKGFNEVLENIADLTLDTPEAPVVIGQFIARAVADDCLPPKFVSSFKGNVESDNAQKALAKADILLSMNHGIVRLDNVWGVGGGNRPVKYLVKRMTMLLKEYLSSGDLDEAQRCIKELDVPHFHHELIYQSVMLIFEESGERAMDALLALIKNLVDSVVITPDQLRKGMYRVYEDMPDICLDVPTAYMQLEKLGNKMHTQGTLGDKLLKDLPLRGRKRFVSEGDGGRVKEMQMH